MITFFTSSMPWPVKIHATVDRLWVVKGTRCAGEVTLTGGWTCPVDNARAIVHDKESTTHSDDTPCLPWTNKRKAKYTGAFRKYSFTHRSLSELYAQTNTLPTLVYPNVLWSNDTKWILESVSVEEGIRLHHLWLESDEFKSCCRLRTWQLPCASSANNGWFAAIIEFSSQTSGGNDDYTKIERCRRCVNLWGTGRWVC